MSVVQEAVCLSTRPCVMGEVRKYKVGRWTVDVLVYDDVTGTARPMAEAYDRARQPVPGAVGIEDTEAEAVRTCLQRWVNLVKCPPKPEGIFIEAEA